jgi:hypothetical protein
MIPEDSEMFPADQAAARAEFARQAAGDRPPTYSKGKLSPEDQGDLFGRIGIVNGRIVIDFGKGVTWLALTIDDAEALAQVLTAKANDLRMASDG